MSVLKLPSIDECSVTSGFDGNKGKTWITLTYDGIPITEWWPDVPHGTPHEEVMTYIVDRCRKRLAMALAARRRKQEADQAKKEVALRRQFLLVK